MIKNSIKCSNLVKQLCCTKIQLKKGMAFFILLNFVLLTNLLGGCVSTKAFVDKPMKSDFSFKVNPETFEIIIDSNGVKETASEAMSKKEVMNLKESKEEVTWSYPKESIDVILKKENNYLNVKIKSGKVEEFTWPRVEAESYTLPLGEGKLIPSDDIAWKTFLDKRSYTLSEGFTMQFFALNKKNYSILYIIENMFNNEITFDGRNKLTFSLNHEFSATNKQKEYSFRIYVTSKNPVDIASVYSTYIKEKGEFTTLEEKALSNSNIRKLYGAPHIYLWGKEFIAKDNIDWKRLSKLAASKEIQWIKSFVGNNIENGTEVLKELDNMSEGSFISEYQKKLITNSLNQILLSDKLYNADVFTSLDKEASTLAGKGIDKLSEVEFYKLNKSLLKSALKDAADPIEKWGNGNSIELLKDMNKAGIKNAWLGFGDWVPGYINPEFVKYANKNGYLIGPYDSYHSIHEKGDEDWITAYFKDKSLYEGATITNKHGKKVAGFLGRGRKLNPTMSIASVQERVQAILDAGIDFNSWFIDCDAAGEFYDDYSPAHITTQEQDMKARLKRMEYIRDNKNVVIGSEQGNDYASQTISFAHGLETPVIAWGDEDMRKNKDSKYYVGQYWTLNGGVPPRYIKQVPVKDLYRSIYIDPTYSLPLFKLVYNDSVITSHHWEWGSLKIKDEVKNRMLYEVLYNVPPLYHLDKNAWSANKEIIASHIKLWSPFHKKAVTRKMTDFKILSDDRLVQMTEYGDDLRVIANFSDKDFTYKNTILKAKSLIIYDSGKMIKYTP